MPSIAGLRKMLEICEEYGHEYSVDYNPTKTVCVLFNRRKVHAKPDVQLCGATLKWVDKVKHLGNYLESNLQETTEITVKKSDLIQRVNSLLVNLGRSKDCVISKVFNTQCAHFYGSQAWNFDDKIVSQFQTTWNHCVRRIFNLPSQTHRHYLPHLVGTVSANDQIYGRFVKMIVKMQKSNNQRVSFLARFCIETPRSITNGNLQVIARRLGIDTSSVITGARGMLRCTLVSECSDSDRVAIMILTELRQCLTGESEIVGFSNEEVECILYDVCVE